MADDSARKRGRRAGSPPLGAGRVDADSALDEARRALVAERARTASLEAELDALRNSSLRCVPRAKLSAAPLGLARWDTRLSNSPLLLAAACEPGPTPPRLAASMTSRGIMRLLLSRPRARGLPLRALAGCSTAETAAKATPAAL